MNTVHAENTFLDEGIKKYNQKEYKDSKFLFQRNIVFNPKDYNSYLYLAKIFKNENNNIEFEINLNTTLLLNPENEEAMYMLIEQKIDQSNFLEVAELKEKFSKICKELCDKKKLIDQKLKNFDTNNEVE